MTEYWVSQGNKWCDFCKIFISNNPTSIRNHELGQRHKDNVSKKLNTMRQEKVAKEKEEKEAVRVLQQIEDKAQRSYQKDIASFQEPKGSTPSIAGDWEYDNSSGYYYNQSIGCHYDPNSGFYYTEALGKWVTREEALAVLKDSSVSNVNKPILKKPLSASETGLDLENKGSGSSSSVRAPGRVVSTQVNPKRSTKGAPSSLTVTKRKRPDEKSKAISAEEAAALKAREAARKRVEEREKSLLGLYKH